MDADDRSAPLLGNGNGGLARPPSLRRRDSARSLRSSFLSRLPDKMRTELDPERAADVDVARVKDLSEGNHHSSSLVHRLIHGGAPQRLRSPCREQARGNTTGSSSPL